MNIGIAGLGAIAPLHIRAILDRGQKITAICDVDAEKCKKLTLNSISERRNIPIIIK